MTVTADRTDPGAEQGTDLETETFTGATADPRFRAFGSACLTGADCGAPPGPGEHPLAGCSTTQVGPVPPGSGAPFGYLQLTDASNDQSGAVLFDSPIAASDGLDVTFEQWQYGNTSQVPADGISFFLADATGSLDAPGAFGGSLGYAQKLPDDNPANPFLPGVNNGYLGVGLDVLGNYFGDWEQRGNGCEQRSPAGTVFRIPAPGPNMVTVRGPGDGTTGYCWLDATTSNKTTTGPWPSTLPGQLQGTLTSIPPGTSPEDAQTLLEPSKRTVHIQITPAPDPTVTVSIDFQDGQGSQQVLSFDAPEPVPANYSFGFAGSTGLFTDVHLIRKLTISTVRPPASLKLVKKLACLHKNTIVYKYKVTNTGEVAVDPVTIADDNATQLHCTNQILAPGDTVVCTGRHVITHHDRKVGYVMNAATATGDRADDGEPVVSNEACLTVAVRCHHHHHPYGGHDGEEGYGHCRLQISQLN
ncbi:MAG: hypothetical protein WCA46_23775 [Actinocatenispora sp.]